MKYIFAILLAVLLVLPSFAQTGVDNCCQLGRACSTDAEWDKGYYDYVNGLCPAPNMSMSQPLVRDGYTFVGAGASSSQVFRLSPGKWRIRTEMSRRDWTYIRQVTSSGERDHGGKCLAWPQFWSWYGWSADWLGIWWSSEFVARTNCLVRLEFYHHVSFNPAGETYKAFLKKVDGNF